MQSQRILARIGAILSILGGALVIFGVFFLPMVFGHGVSSADVPNFEFVQFSVLLVLPLLSVLIILGTSAVSFFRELSPGMVALRRIAAIIGLIIQGPLGFVWAVLGSFSIPPHPGAGYWLALLGFIVMIVGTFLN